MGKNYGSCGNLAWSDPEHRLRRFQRTRISLNSKVVVKQPHMAGAR